MFLEFCNGLLLAFIGDEKIIFAEIEDGIPFFISHIDLDQLNRDLDFVAELGLFLLARQNGMVRSKIRACQNKEGDRNT